MTIERLKKLSQEMLAWFYSEDLGEDPDKWVMDTFDMTEEEIADIYYLDVSNRSEELLTNVCSYLGNVLHNDDLTPEHSKEYFDMTKKEHNKYFGG